MRRLARTTLPALAALAAAATSATTAYAQYTVYSLANTAGAGQQLVSFNSATPSSVTVVGATGVNLTGIDFRPANNVLYGYDGLTVFSVNTTTGAATSLFSTTATTGNGGFDFNPAADRLRIVSPGGTNLRLNIGTQATTTDGAYTFVAGDPNVGVTPSFSAVAYTNSDNDPATGTTLYGVDSNLGQLIQITNPNGGTVSTVGSLGLGRGAIVTGFDIVTVGSANFGFLSVRGQAAGTNALYNVDLTTGSTTLVGAIGVNGFVEDIAIAATPEPGTWMLLATGLAGVGLAARRRRAGRA